MLSCSGIELQAVFMEQVVEAGVAVRRDITVGGDLQHCVCMRNIVESIVVNNPELVRCQRFH